MGKTTKTINYKYYKLARGKFRQIFFDPTTRMKIVNDQVVRIDPKKMSARTRRALSRGHITETSKVAYDKYLKGLSKIQTLLRDKNTRDNTLALENETLKAANKKLKENQDVVTMDNLVKKEEEEKAQKEEDEKEEEDNLTDGPFEDEEEEEDDEEDELDDEEDEEEEEEYNEMTVPELVELVFDLPSNKKTENALKKLGKEKLVELLEDAE